MDEDYRISPEVALIYDIPRERRTEKEKLLLERHFNDLYAVFLRKLTGFALNPAISEEETSRLKRFFDELLRARAALLD